MMFELLLMVINKIIMTTSLCTLLVTIPWYFGPMINRMLVLLAYYGPIMALTLFFMVVLGLQRELYRINSVTMKRELEDLRQSSERNRIRSASLNAGPSFWTTQNFDTMLDFVLREASSYIIGSQSVPDVNEKIRVPMPLGYETDCHFVAMEGLLEHADSLHRDGHAVVHREADGTLVLEAAVGLRKLVVRYLHYSANIDMGILPPIYASGNLTAIVSPLTMRVVVALRSQFAAELRSLEVEQIGLYKVDLTGLGEWAFMWPKVEATILPRLQTKLRQEAPLRVEPIFRQALSNLTRMAAGIPQFRIFEVNPNHTNRSVSRPRALLATAPPTVTLTPTNIAVGSVAAIGAVGLLGYGIASLLGSRSRSNRHD